MGSYRAGHDWSDLAAAGLLKEPSEELLFLPTCPYLFVPWRQGVGSSLQQRPHLWLWAPELLLVFVGYNLTELLYIINMCTRESHNWSSKRTVHWTLTRHQNTPHSHDIRKTRWVKRLLSTLSSLVNNVGSRWQLTAIFQTCYIHSQTKIWTSKVPDLYKISRHLLFYLNC